MDALRQTDEESAAFAVKPRVALADIEGSIAATYYTNAAKAVGDGVPLMVNMDKLSICILVMKNGFMVVGKSAPASPENFNAEYGQKLAYQDAVRQLWPLMGFALCERLTNSKWLAAELTSHMAR